MKRIAFVAVVLSLVGVGYATHPDEFMEYAGKARAAGLWAWEGIQANPVPVALALGTFLLTVVYHKAKGKSLRESVEVAATRVALVPIPLQENEEENPVVRRAKARATRAQLLADQVAIQNRQRKLPDELLKAEKEACYTEQAVADAEWKLTAKRTAHEESSARLEALRKEAAAGEAELAEIDGELKKLAEVV
jgi:hypothetical protein